MIKDEENDLIHAILQTIKHFPANHGKIIIQISDKRVQSIIAEYMYRDIRHIKN